VCHCALCRKQGRNGGRSIEIGKSGVLKVKRAKGSRPELSKGMGRWVSMNVRSTKPGRAEVIRPTRSEQGESRGEIGGGSKKKKGVHLKNPLITLVNARS